MVGALVALGAGWVSPGRMARRVYAAGLAVCAVAATAFLFSGVYYRSAHGLLFTTPWVVPALVNARQAWRTGGTTELCLAGTALLGLLGYGVAIVLLRAAAPDGGLEWGARFAMPFYPLLALWATWPKSEHRTEWTVALAGMLVVLGIGFQVRGLITLQHDKQINARLNQALADVPETLIATDLYWLPLNAAPMAEPKPIFIGMTPQRLAEWTGRAHQQGVSTFALVTLDPGRLEQVSDRLTDLQLERVSQERIENLHLLRVQVRGAEWR
jgi:multisubunit Na+/H+ antiporter MnhB subunit